MYMIVGLGNPGDRYAMTKHNVGFWVIDEIAKEMGVEVDKKQCQAFTQTGFWQGKKVLLVKPQTYMNLSGQSVIELLNYYQDQIEDFIIVHDDLDMVPGKIRLRADGSPGGHNGLKNIAQHLNSNEYDRLKIGIGRGTNEVKDYVLTPFCAESKQAVDEAVEKSIKALAVWMEEGISKAMNQFNTKK